MRTSTLLGLAVGSVLCVAMVAVGNPATTRHPVTQSSRPAPTPSPSPVGFDYEYLKRKPAQADMDLMSRWMLATNACVGDNHPADGICEKRDKIERLLAKHGWCWSYSDYRVTPPDFKWHDCAITQPAGWAAPIAEIPDETVTLEKFEQVQLNMRRTDVAKILGAPGVDQSTMGGLGMDQYETVTWGNPDGSGMIVTFRNGLLASKIQNHLS